MSFGKGSIQRVVLLACLAMVAVPMLASAADSLDVILVQGANEGESDAALKPYLPLLARSGLKSYRVVSRRKAVLQAGEVKLDKGFKATLGTVDGRRVPVTISREGKNLIRTTVSFAPGHPVILGTYDGPGGEKMIVVLVLATQ